MDATSQTAGQPDRRAARPPGSQTAGQPVAADAEDRSQEGSGNTRRTATRPALTVSWETLSL